MSQRYLAIVLGLSFALAPASHAEERSRYVMTEDKTHVRTWNDFADACLALHKQQIANNKVREQTRVGGYANRPEFFKEHTYYNADTGVMLSRIQWEKDKPENMHACEVYVHDDQGRVVRDYAVAYLPEGRNAPVQTLINLHAYNDGMHAFRQFDASGDRIYEFCEGNFQGKKVQLRRFEDDIYSGPPGDTSTPLYVACFEGLPMKPGQYLDPQ